MRVRDQYGLLLLLDQLLLLKELVLELVITHVLVRRLKPNETIRRQRGVLTQLKDLRGETVDPLLKEDEDVVPSQ